MFRAFSTIIVAVTLSALVAGAIVRGAGPTTAELDSDITSTKIEIQAAEQETTRYSGGVILAQVQLRAAILKSTLAMLEEKRASLLRGVTLSYQDPSPRIPAPVDEAEILSELAKARADAEAAGQEAARYSGGLIQMMALMREATAKVTESAIEQRIALGKLGIPLARLPNADALPPKPPGKTAPDKDAL